MSSNGLWPRSERIIISQPDEMLQLHSLTGRDAPAMHAAIFADPYHLNRFGENIAIKYPTEEAVARLLDEPNGYPFAMKRPDAPDEVVGCISLFMAVGIWANVTYWVSGPHTGHRYARTSVKMLSDFVFRQTGLGTLFAAAREDNRASLATLTGAGFSTLGSIDMYKHFWFSRDAWQERGAA